MATRFGREGVCRKRNRATAPFSASAGLSRISATHQGEGNFFVHMLDKDGYVVGYALVNEIGTSEASTTVTVPEDGIYLFNVQADGPWTIEVQ